MTKPLQSSSIAAPGFFGLNTQESGITLDSGFALQATNCVIDKFGRLGARKGWQFLANTITDGETVTSATGVDLQGMHRFVDIDATEYFGAWSDDSFYLYLGGTLVPVTYGGAQTITTGNWQAVTLNDSAYLFQKNYEPLYFDTVTGQVLDISDSPSASGTPIEGNCALSAYGRIWTADTATNTTTLYWTDLLDGSRWNSGTAGSLDLSSILVYGNDEIIGIGAHNGYLIVFCKQNIVIFGDSDSSQTYLDPETLQLIEVISGVGCIARDSIVNTGGDILFLSESGVRSLGRVIQEKSQPMREVSKNVRDDLVQFLEGETKADIKAVYSERYAVYLLAFPSTNKVYCFDMRGPLQDGSARVTVWDNMNFTSWLAFDGTIYMTHEDGLAQYFGYQDNGSSYRMTYFTNYFDLGDASVSKILKRLSITVIGAVGQNFVVKSGFDYSDIYQSYSLDVRQGTIYEYGANAPQETIGKYGLTTATPSVSQTSTTITNEDTDPNEHFTVDFQTTQDAVYNVPLLVYLDADGYYYHQDDGSRTETTLYVKSVDFAAEYSGGVLVDTIRIAASGSGNVMQLGFEADVNGGALSIQKMDIYVKQGRIL
jgi:hypothetical protein